LSGNTSVCFDQFSGGTFNVEACWVFGGNYTWSIQGSNNYSTSLYGSGNNILSVSIPSDASSEFITVSATGIVNGVQQTNSIQINISDCGYYYMKQNNKIDSKNLDISISPNPAHDYINLFLSVDLLQQDLNVEIYNMVGQKIKQIDIEGFNSRIDVANLQIGLYHVVVRDKNKIILFTKKFTKI
jgi:Secretion system C-terminal sorting domain